VGFICYLGTGADCSTRQSVRFWVAPAFPVQDAGKRDTQRFPANRSAGGFYLSISIVGNILRRDASQSLHEISVKSGRL
jgi:hypothetical protein